MKTDKRFYSIIKQIHLYSTLLTVALLLMYIITSYMMIYHDWFKVERKSESTEITISSKEEVSDENWQAFLDQHKVRGRLVGERFDDSGNLIRNYASATDNAKITINNDGSRVKIETTKLNMSGSIIGLHRMRGYGGSLVYNIYAMMLDIVGVSLLLFATTGVILWLKLLKFNKVAWAIFIFGFIYIGSVIIYLNLH